MQNRNTSGSNSSNTDVVCCLSPAEIEEGNDLIKGFMKLKVSNGVLGDSRIYYYVQLATHEIIAPEGDFKYHISWDWLMPVVEKVENEMKWAYSVETHRYLYGHHLKGQRYCCIIHDSGDALRLEIESDSKIEAVWQAVVEFIKWYNQNVVSER